MLGLAVASYVSKHVQEHGGRTRVKSGILRGDSLQAFTSNTTAPNPTRRARQIPETPVAVKMHELEQRIERQESATRELAFRINAGSSQDRVDEVVAYMENAFKTLDHVVGVHYAVLQDGTWHVVTVHNMEDGGRALRSICKKAVEVQNAFHSVEIAPVVLHVDEVLREHLAGTKTVFNKNLTADQR